METIEARVIQKIATPEQWRTIDYTPYKGEFLIVGDASGKVTNIKVGDGSNDFDGLEYMFDSIQQNANYIPVSGYALPTPEADSGFTMLVEGDYTFGGNPAFTVTEGNFGIASWDGSAWSLEGMGELPQVQGTNVLDPDGEGIPKEKAVADYALEKTSPRALPYGFEYIENDRPDLVEADIIQVDKNGLYVPKPDYSNSLLPEGFEFIVDDRPDTVGLGLVLIDSNSYYIPQSNESSAFDNLIAFQDFGEMEGYAVETVKDPNNYWQIWEGMRTADSNYVTRQPLRNSSLLGLPNWRYDFKPKSPKIKVLLIGLAHGWEKNISFGWARLMNQLVNDWRGNEALTLLRQNVHFITVPLMSPDNFVTNPFNGSNRTRSRQNYETDWIEASFSASGTDINVTFTESDFPTNELHTFADYFQERKDDIEGKTGVTVIDSTDTDAVKHNAVYRLKTVISAGSIVLTNDIAVDGTVTGTLKFCVRVDPERNYPTTTWARFTPGSPTSAPITYYDNKGTKPISTMENANVYDIINSNTDISTIMDFHSGAGDYVTYVSVTDKDKSFDVLNSMFESLFNVETSTPASTYPMSSVYAAESLGIPATLPEWHSSEPPEVGAMTNEQATELHNWLGNILYVTSIRNINNKK